MDILEKLGEERNWAQNTLVSYKTAMNHYVDIQEKSIGELLKEAQKEEESKVSWKESKLRLRLINFRKIAFSKYNISTAKLQLTRVMSFYRAYDITLGELPYISEKQVEKTPPIRFNDLPDKEIIKKAVNISSTVLKAIILFISSSGCARTETLNLTINDFIKATKMYHDETEINKVIKKLSGRNDVVPTFELRRQKTGGFYYTFCSLEATEAILNYLSSRKESLTPETGLFKINSSYFFKRFAEINNTLNLGKVGGKNRFRSHMLRKFHASQLNRSYDDPVTGESIPGMDMGNIDALQGRVVHGSQQSYFFKDFDSLKQEYIKNLPKLLIFTENLPAITNNQIEPARTGESIHKNVEYEPPIKQNNQMMGFMQSMTETMVNMFQQMNEQQMQFQKQQLEILQSFQKQEQKPQVIAIQNKEMVEKRFTELESKIIEHEKRQTDNMNDITEMLHKRTPEGKKRIARWSDRDIKRLIEYHNDKIPLDLQVKFLNKRREQVMDKRYAIGLSWENGDKPYTGQDYEMRYITKQRGRWIVKKTINNNQEYFGSFKNLEEAKEERDLLEKFGWDYELMIESIDETDNGKICLNNKIVGEVK